jgi:hypothetical protein
MAARSPLRPVPRALACAALLSCALVGTGCGGGSKAQRSSSSSTSTQATSSSPAPRPPARARYAARVKATILRTCKAAAGGAADAQAACRCVLRYVEARVSQRELKASERAILKGEATVPQWMRDAAAACRGQ